MPSPDDLLADLASALEQLGLRWYLFGAQAVVLYGRPRLTEDVDITVELGDLDRDAFVRCLEDHGFIRSPIADDEFIEVTRVVPFLHEASGMALDAVLAGPGLEELFLQGARLTRIGSLEIPVIRAEHLLVTKILAARSKDLEDARGIVGAGGDLDFDEIRDVLEQLESALGQSDLVSVLDDLRASTSDDE